MWKWYCGRALHFASVLFTDALRTKRAKESINEPTRSGITFARQKAAFTGYRRQAKLSPVEIFQKESEVNSVSDISV
jgi:hypothetical protein